MIKVNLCGTGLKDFINIDISWKANKRVDLEKKRIPMKDNSVDILICMNGIGYFTRERAQFLIKDVYRILKPDGVCRFGTQNLALICRNYLDRDPDFQCDRINEWFNGYEANSKNCKYVYDYMTLKYLFVDVGFSKVLRWDFLDGRIAEWDNRPEQQFFLEAVK
jgi:predicted SAM-dependent methyltransferase